jgi:outer membrane receptor protein involved in Fe transport
VFAGQQWLPGLDHGHNEAEALSGGLHLQRRLAEQSFDAVAAVQERAFGARGFYGVSPARRSVESTQDALALASWRLGLAQPADFVRTTASVRRFADDYILDDKDPPYYRNQHRTLISSAAADGRLSGGERVALTWRVWAEDERIDSGGVFKGAGTRGLGRHDRQRLGAMLLPELALGDLTLRGGGQAVLFSEDSPVALALAGADYAAGDRHHLYASVTQQVRQPSFTELDYESPASLGNAGLGNERSTEVEAGLKSSWSPTCRTRVAGFRRRTKDTIDWVRQAPGGRWLATDLGEVTTTGIEAEAAYSPSPNLALSLFGQSLTKRGEMDIYASRYVYNYPEERLGLAACWSPVAWCELRTQQTVMVHADNPARTSDRWGTESSLAVAVKPPHWTGLALGLEVTNLFDDDTQLLPGQKRSGQRVMGTVKACW